MHSVMRRADVTAKDPLAPHLDLGLVGEALRERRVAAAAGAHGAQLVDGLRERQQLEDLHMTRLSLYLWLQIGLQIRATPPRQPLPYQVEQWLPWAGSQTLDEAASAWRAMGAALMIRTVAKGRRWKVPSRAAMMTTFPSLAHFSANLAMSAKHRSDRGAWQCQRRALAPKPAAAGQALMSMVCAMCSGQEST